MPRQSRRKSSTGIYHVMIRGINKQAIFSDDEDNKRFLQILFDCKAICEFELYGYCLMGNHVHILLKEVKEPLERIFKRIGSRYVLWYNRKYQRCGHLFQDRYKSEAVENDSYFSVVLRYIHQNPIKATMCKSLSEHEWSSYNEYFSESKLIDRELALGIIGEVNFIKYMSERKEDNCLENIDLTTRILDKDLSRIIEDTFNTKPIMIQNEAKERVEYILRYTLRIKGVSTRQLARVTGVPVNRIWKL